MVSIFIGRFLWHRGREALTRAFQEYDNIIGIEKVLGDRIAPPSVLAELNQVAAADLIVDRDGKVRRGFITVEQQQGFGTRLAELYLTLHNPEVDELGRELVDPSINQFPQTKIQSEIQPLRAGDRGYVSAQMTLEGEQILLDYREDSMLFSNCPFRM